MILENLLFILILGILILIMILLIISKGFLREIFKQDNYIKFIQFIFIIVLLFVFIASFIYFWVNQTEVDKMDVIFTVIVGWIGLIIGAFFGQKFMEGLSENQETSSKEMLETLEDYVELLEENEEQMEDLLEVIDDYEEELKKLKK